MTTQHTIGFIGQGWIGKTYADDFERRGHKVARYAKGEPYTGNAGRIREGDIVCVAGTTPTTPWPPAKSARSAWRSTRSMTC